MANITITIPDAKVQRVLDAISGLHPIPQIVDPANPPQLIDEFTKAQWAREWLKRTLRKTVSKYETIEAQKIVAVPEDDTIVDVT